MTAVQICAAAYKTGIWEFSVPPLHHPPHEQTQQRSLTIENAYCQIHIHPLHRPQFIHDILLFPGLKPVQIQFPVAFLKLHGQLIYHFYKTLDGMLFTTCISALFSSHYSAGRQWYVLPGSPQWKKIHNQHSDRRSHQYGSGAVLQWVYKNAPIYNTMQIPITR